MNAVNRQQFCAALGISESTVRRLELAGLPFTPIGARGKRYDVDECKRWLRGRGCQSGSTETGAVMLESCSMAGAYIESFQKAHRRVMPSASRLKSVQPSGNDVLPFPATRHSST